MEITVGGGWSVPARATRGRPLLTVPVGKHSQLKDNQDRGNLQWERLVVPVYIPGPILSEDVIQFHLQKLLDSLKISSSPLTCSKGSVNVVPVVTLCGPAAVSDRELSP